MIAVLQFVPGHDEALRILSGLLEPCPAGSTLAISTVTAHNPQAVAAAAAYRARGIHAIERTDDEVTALFSGLDLVDPGVVPVNKWRPDAEAAAIEDSHIQMAGGLAVRN